MIKSFICAAIMLAVMQSPTPTEPAPTECDGCSVVKKSTAVVLGLDVTFPATMRRGTCSPCATCGECIGTPCRFDGEFVMHNTGPGAKYLFRRNNEIGRGEILAGKKFRLSFFDERVSCGYLDRFHDWKWVTGGQAYLANGEVQIGCSPCAPKTTTVK